MERTLSVNGTPVETRVKLLLWQERGLSFSATGYGRRIPTSYQVKLNGRWRRVYCYCFSNSGTCYVEDRTTRKDNGRFAWLVVSE